MSELAAVASADFKGTLGQDGLQLKLVLSGNADYAAVDAVEELLTKAHAEATRLKVPDVAIDFTDLEFMNSSCFKCFVAWINQIQEMADRDQYKVGFLSNPKMHWQKRSLHSLQCFSTELISITDA